MKKIKNIKLISLLIIIVYIVGMLPAHFVLADDGLSDEQKALLSVVGVYDETQSLDTALTKGEFASLLAKGVFAENEDITTYKPQTRLTDVDEFTDCYQAVSALHALGFAGVDKFGRFYPDNKITYNEAVSMIHRALGYSDSYVEARWKTPENFAVSKKVSKGVTVGSGSAVSVYSAYVLIYNMLICDISDQFDGEKTIYMSYKHDLYEIEGVVTHDGVVSYDGMGSLKAGHIMIGEDEFVNESGIVDLFGQNICGWYRETRDKDILVAIYQNIGENEVITLASSDIAGMDNKTYSYESDDVSGKLKKASFDSSSDIFYNGKKLGIDDPFTDDMFVPKNGRVRLYNNDSDNTIEIVRIEDFDVGIVGAVDLEDRKIYVSNSRIVDIGDSECIIEDKYGMSVELGSITKNNVVSWCEAFDGEVTSVVVSTESYTDIVSEFESTGNGIITTESGARYVLSDYAVDTYETPEVGGSYVFFFDAFDMLVGIVKDTESSGNRFGYIAGMTKRGTLSPTYIIRIFTQTGEFQDYELNKDIKILNEKNKTEYWSKDKVYTDFAYRGIVRYDVNGDKKLTYIEVPLAYGSVPDTEDRMFYLIDTHENENKEDYQAFEAGDGINIGSAAIVTASTVVIHRPDNIDDYDNYRLGGISSFKDYGKYDMYVIGTDYRKKMADAVVLHTAFSEKISSEYPYAVKKVVKAYDAEKDQTAYKLDLMNRNGEESSYFMEIEDYENEVLTIANGITTPVRIQPGDIIYMSTGNGYILKAVLLFDFDQEVPDKEGNMIKGAIAGTQLGYYSTANKLSNPFYFSDQGAQNAGSNSAWKYYTSGFTVLSGWVYSCEDGFITITNQNPAYGIDLSKDLDDGAVMGVYSYNRGVVTESEGKNDVNLKAMTASDIKTYLDYGADCSRVVFVKYLWSSRMLNIIND